MKLLKLCLPVLAALAFAASAQAGPITSVTLDDCDAMGCQGVELTLDVEDEGGTWLVTYTIDASGYTGTELGLNQLGFKTVSGWTSAELISASPDLLSWSDPIEAPVNSNSLCSNISGGSSKVCIHGFVDISGGGIYEWQFRLTGGTLLDTEDWHFGGQFADGAGESSGKLISAAIPEPSAAILFGLGAMVIGTATRRR